MKKSRPCPAPAALAARVLLAVLLAVATTAAQARPELCEAAASRAASETGVPVDVLRAIALTETGRMVAGRLRPWPWAANADGQGHWFDSADEALAFAREQVSRGRNSFDLGCFQINWRWHGAHFTSPVSLLDPLESARYAARFLRRLHAELGDWEAAAGAYHSRTPQLAARYRARFARLRAGIAADQAGPPILSSSRPLARSPRGGAQAAVSARNNTFPLLQVPSEGGARSASLVPEGLPGGPAFLPALQVQLP